MKANVEWMKYLTRPTFTPLWLGPFIQAYQENVPAVIGVGLTAHLFIPSEKGVEWYVSKDEFANLGTKVVQMIKQRPGFADEHRRQCIETSEALVNVCKSIGGMALKSKSSQELYGLFGRYSEKFRDFVVFLAIPPAVDRLLSEEVERRLRETLDKQGRLDLRKTYFDALTTLTELTDAMKEELELLEIAAKVEEDDGRITPETDKMVDAHTEKYRWLPVYAFHLDPLTKDFFLKKIGKIEGARELLGDKQREFEAGKERAEEILTELRPSEDLLNLIRTLQGYIFLRTYRTDMLRKGFYHIQPLVEEIGRRARMSRREVAYLTQEELEGFLIKGGLPDHEEVKERIKHFLLLKKPGIYEVISDEAEIDRITKQELAIAEMEAGILRGQGIYPGKATGSVKIIWSIDDAHKMEQGDILVTSMTTPDMHFIIVKAGAIVTDEGGMTSHAALVSRELQIPCVIGTEMATKIFKDGDRVEVDSEKGIVTKV